MHVLRRVFQQAVAPVVILDVVEGDGLEASPPQGHDEGVPCLQDALIPAVLLQSHLTHTHTHTRTIIRGRGYSSDASLKLTMAVRLLL